MRRFVVLLSVLPRRVRSSGVWYESPLFVEMIGQHVRDERAGFSQDAARAAFESREATAKAEAERVEREARRKPRKGRKPRTWTVKSLEETLFEVNCRIGAGRGPGQSNKDWKALKKSLYQERARLEVLLATGL